MEHVKNFLQSVVYAALLLIIGFVIYQAWELYETIPPEPPAPVVAPTPTIAGPMLVPTHTPPESPRGGMVLIPMPATPAADSAEVAALDAAIENTRRVGAACMDKFVEAAANGQAAPDCSVIFSQLNALQVKRYKAARGQGE